MNLQVIGCSHHSSSLAVREKLAFTEPQAVHLLNSFYIRFPESEAVLLSTCNRTEFYVAGRQQKVLPSQPEMISLLAEHRELDPQDLENELFMHRDRTAIRHLFSVASSLDSMVIGETQILGQVKKAYQLATELNPSGSITHHVFQSAIRVARRIANDTELHSDRLSVPSVAAGTFAKQIFQRLDDKQILIIGAGKMAVETLRYFVAEGVQDFTVVNRTRANAEALAQRFNGRSEDWELLDSLLVSADLIVCASGASQAVLTNQRFDRIEKARDLRPLLILDLAVPRNVDPAIGERFNVYLYTLDDLRLEYAGYRHARSTDFRKAEMILDEETDRFLSELSLRSSNGTISQLKQQAEEVKLAELKRLFNKMELDENQRTEIEQSFNRLVNKILHPPLKSIRDDEADLGLVDALKRLFQLRD
jgi:glutamyl-tRNA reductase